MWNENIPETIKKLIDENKSGINKVAAFGGLPLKREFDGEDFCIVGIPYDTSTTRREGTRFGPRAIRKQSPRLSNEKVYSQDAHYLVDNLKGMDYGDLPVLGGYTEVTFQVIYEGMKNVLENGCVPIVLGGII